MHQRPSTDRTSFIRYIPGGWGHAVLNLAESIGFARRYADALLLSAFKGCLVLPRGNIRNTLLFRHRFVHAAMISGHCYGMNGCGSLRQ